MLWGLTIDKVSVGYMLTRQNVSAPNGSSLIFCLCLIEDIFFEDSTNFSTAGCHLLIWCKGQCPFNRTMDLVGLLNLACFMKNVWIQGDLYKKIFLFQIKTPSKLLSYKRQILDYHSTKWSLRRIPEMSRDKGNKYRWLIVSKPGPEN